MSLPGGAFQEGGLKRDRHSNSVSRQRVNRGTAALDRMRKVACFLNIFSSTPENKRMNLEMSIIWDL